MAQRLHVIGATGQVGQALLHTRAVWVKQRANNPSQQQSTNSAGDAWEVVPYTRNTCNLADPGVFAPGGGVDIRHGDVVVNCAAYTAVDQAETDEGIAFQVNARAAGELALRCAEEQAALIHLSTDYVFSGDNGGKLWDTTDIPAPLSVYGASKRAGEEAVMEAGGLSTIVRTSWVYTGPRRYDWAVAGEDFVTTMLNVSERRDELTVVDDQFGSPTYSVDLACGLWELAQRYAEHLRDTSAVPIPLVLHASNRGVCSWWEFACHIMRLAGREQVVVSPCLSSEFPQVALRPTWSALSPSIWYNAGLSALPEWQDGLRRAVGNHV